MKFFVSVALLFTALYVRDVHAVPQQYFKRDGLVFNQPCPAVPGHPQAPLLTVTADPSSPKAGEAVKFTYSGPINHELTESDAVGIAWVDTQNPNVPLKAPKFDTVCNAKKTGTLDEKRDCPIPANTKFTQDTHDTAPTKLPAKYAVAVGIGNINTLEIYACAAAIGTA